MHYATPRALSSYSPLSPLSLALSCFLGGMEWNGMGDLSASGRRNDETGALLSHDDIALDRIKE